MVVLIVAVMSAVGYAQGVGVGVLAAVFLMTAHAVNNGSVIVILQ